MFLLQLLTVFLMSEKKNTTTLYLKRKTLLTETRKMTYLSCRLCAKFLVIIPNGCAMFREFDLMFLEADQNNDGKIDFDEFVAMMLPATLLSPEQQVSNCRQ